jgi:hypothetical protein
MSINDIAENFGKAFPRAFTPENIFSGFQATGVGLSLGILYLSIL